MEAFPSNSDDLAAGRCGNGLQIQRSASGALGRWLGDVISVDSLTATTTDATLEVTVAYRLLSNGEQRTETFTQGEPT